MYIPTDEPRQIRLLGFRLNALRKSTIAFSLSLVLAVCLVPSTGAAAPSVPGVGRLQAGFSVGPVGSNAKWFYFGTPDGAFVGDDGNTFTAGGALKRPSYNTRRLEYEFANSIGRVPSAGSCAILVKFQEAGKNKV